VRRCDRGAPALGELDPRAISVVAQLRDGRTVVLR
jgi:hypothetical protein